MKEANQTIYFATKNRNKYREAARIVSPYGIELKYLSLEKEEIQADNLADIASHAAVQAANATSHTVVAEDAGFFVEALKGFPGPYSSYVFRTLGLSGILKLMRTMNDRRAYFSATLAYCKPGLKPTHFNGKVSGAVSSKAKGSQGFGFDPIFIPTKGQGLTFAEMTTDEKNSLSHRARAFTKFARWFSGKR